MLQAFGTHYLYLATDAGDVFFLLLLAVLFGVQVMGRVVMYFVNSKDQKALEDEQHYYLMEQEQARQLRGVWRELAQTKKYAYTPGVPEFGRLEGTRESLDWAATGLTSQEGQNTIATVKVGVRGPHHVSLLLHDPKAMRGWLESFVPHQLPERKAIQPFTSESDKKTRPLPRSEVDRWPEPLKQRWVGACEVYHNDLVFPWRLSPRDHAAQLDSALGNSLKTATTIFRNAEAAMGTQLATAYTRPIGLWSQINAALLITCFYPRHKECAPIAARWLKQWQEDWYPRHSDPPEQHFHAMWHDPERLYLQGNPHPRRIWFELIMTLLKELIQDHTDSGLSAALSLPFQLALTERPTDRKLILQHFAQTCQSLPVDRAELWLESEELCGPGMLTTGDTEIYIPQRIRQLREPLWKTFTARAKRLDLIEQLASHCRSQLGHCRDEGYKLVGTELNPYEQTRWSHMIFERGDAESWFDCLRFLAEHNSPALESFRVELLQHSWLSDDGQKNVLASMEVDGGPSSFAIIHKMLETGKFSFSVKGIAKKTYEAIKERLGQETAGGLTLIDDAEHQGRLSVADGDEGKLSLEEKSE